MRIIQFSCPSPEVAAQLQALMTSQVNEWSRLRWLSDDPEYVTNPFSVEDWQVHTTDPTLYWTDYDAVYDNLGDSGQRIADQFLKPGAMTGLLLGVALLPDLPNTKLEIVDVADLVADGYLAETVSQEP